MYNAHWIHSLPYSKFIELTLKVLEYRGLSQKFSTFVIGLRQLFPRHIENKRRYVFFLYVRSLRTFKQWKQEMI